MGNPGLPSASSGDDRLSSALRGDAAAWGSLLDELRPRLKRMVALRLDRRLQGRIDPSDVVQEAFLEATCRRDELARDPSVGLLLWLRFLTGQQLELHHRRHLGVQARDAGREVSICGGLMPEASSAALAAQLLGRDTRVSHVAIRAERASRLQDALNAMDPIDREVLALRHFEQLTNQECARVLGIGESAATKRYIRALTRLREVLAALPGGLEELAL
jgi:RNA polymerase sigma-70 factor (ECF subfamily)